MSNIPAKLRSEFDKIHRKCIEIESRIANNPGFTADQRKERLGDLDLLKAYQQILKLFRCSDINLFIKSVENHLSTTSNAQIRKILKSIMTNLRSNLVSYDDEIGITELMDPSRNLTWVGRLRPKANIIITKDLGPIIPQLLQNKYRCIVHVTCTGLGATIYEPMGPHPAKQIKATEQLIQAGFPKEQIVLRLDPIILTPDTVKAAHLVLDYFAQLGIKRCRYSFLDVYDHVRTRFESSGVPCINYFTYSAKQINDFSTELERKYGSVFAFESCAEPHSPHWSPCISQKDLDILGVKNLQLIGKKSSRKNCQCPLNKVELIRGVPGTCSINCMYCYWKGR